MPRPSERHDPTHPALAPHALNPLPTTPGSLSNGGSTHGHPVVSPTVVSTVPNGQVSSGPSSVIRKLAKTNEETWLLIGKRPWLLFLSETAVTWCPGRIAEQMGDLDHAQSAYENALRHNPMSLSGLTQVAGIARIKENYPMVRPN